MLIYNYQKEFVGIDESDLKALGFSDLSQLRSESADFADLFVKTPGFVHNFKHVHWIDFVTCAEGSEDSKVIIHANGKNFRSTLDIKTAFLLDDPSQKAYIINLNNLRALTHNENEQIEGDLLEKPAPRVSTESSAIFSTPDSSSNFEDENLTKTIEEPIQEVEVTHDPYEVSQSDTLDELNTNLNIVEDMYEDTPIDLGEELLEIEDEPEDIIEIEDEISELEKEANEKELAPIYTQELNIGNDYLYDPKLASNELGLPVDLIEEFIQDFISQTNEFKNDLYNSLDLNDIDNIKILSHKLKGVAANLRIEDAYEVLSTINTSDDTEEIKTNVDTLYMIIDKLSNKVPDIQSPQVVESAEDIATNEDDDLILSFKDDDIQENKDEEIKIEVPELEEEEFLISEGIEDIVLDDNVEEIEDLIEITLDDEIEDIEEVSINMLDSEPIVYDKAKAANEIGIDEQNFETLFDDFIIEGNKACSKIISSVEEGDDNLCKQTAIKFKRMSDNMRINDFTSELESIINTQDSEAVKKAVDAISHKLQQISSVKV
ncbi:Hpt domain-containing protein [Sulfurimonas sp.]|uniref:Hpt domain-containing protein n=1 Tax=Sulfurimonas sp. TaxID=2022749 RepID=UPI0025D3337C|nr:Hpt domain-containing protein [Sulfurimonas sp.]